MKHNYVTKLLVLFGLCLGGKLSFAQTFKQVLPPSPDPNVLFNFAGMQNISNATAEVDRNDKWMTKYSSEDLIAHNGGTSY